MGGPTEPALIHHEILGLIVMCLKPGADWRKSLVKMYRDQPPFELVDEKFVLFQCQWATNASDMRSLEDQQNNKMLVLGLTQR